MQIEQIRTQIEEGKNVERQTSVLRGAVVNLAKLNGVSVTEAKVENIIGFVTEYIEHAPALMMVIEESAAANGVQPHVRPLLDATESYFLSPDDAIPDHYGLVGLLDDAYLTHRLVEAISDTCESRAGESFFPIEAREINRFMRRLIGAPFVSILDELVATTLDDLNQEEDVIRISAALAEMNLASVADPIWSNARISDIAVERLASTSEY